MSLRFFRRKGFAMLMAAGGLCVMTGLAGRAQTPAVPTEVSAGRPPAVQAAGQVIAGRVVSAADDHPIANATVSLGRQQQQRNGRRQGGPNAQGQTVRTDAEGRYRFAAQPAERYTLRVSAPGYLASLYLEHEGFSSAIVTGADVATDNLRFALVPEASIHGRVLDETGEPVRANVSLYRDAGEGATHTAAAGQGQRFRPAGGTQADDDGRYEFQNLSPGVYYIAVTATPWYAVHARPEANEEHMAYRTAIDPALDVAYPVTFYPHATTEDGARPVALKAGGRASANLLMQAEHAVTITVQMPPGDAAAGSGIRPFPALFQKVFGNEQGSGGQMFGRFGDTIVLSGVAPGQYQVRSFGRGGPAIAETAVDVSGGSATIQFPGTGAGGASDVRVTLRTPAGSALPDSVSVQLQRVGARRGDGALIPGKVEQGIAQISNVDAGNYRFRLYADGATWNVSRLTVGGKVVTSKLLHVDGGTVQAEVVSSQYSPEIDGFVHAADGKVHPGSLVVLVPAGADTGEDLYRADQSDLDGGFQFNNVLPGNYLLVAIDNDWELNWQESSALMRYLPHALPVTVAASGPKVMTLREAAVVQQR